MFNQKAKKKKLLTKLFPLTWKAASISDVELVQHVSERHSEQIFSTDKRNEIHQAKLAWSQGQASQAGSFQAT